jgi:hypothetical protein
VLGQGERNLQVSGENAFKASWTPASWEPESPGQGLTYELFHNESGTAPAPEASGLPVETTEATVSGLKGGAAYTAWVRSRAGTGKGPWSDGTSITLLKDQTSLTFSIEVFGQTRFGQVRGDSILVLAPINTPKPWRFAPQITLAEGATLVSGPADGEEADFSDPENPVHYLVRAENGRIQDYVVDMRTNDESGLGFALEPPEDILVLDAPVRLSQSANQTKALIVNTRYQNCAWYVDGILKSVNKSLRLRATDYRPGVHYLTVTGYIVYTNEGSEDRVPWSTELVFTVID